MFLFGRKKKEAQRSGMKVNIWGKIYSVAKVVLIVGAILAGVFMLSRYSDQKAAEADAAERAKMEKILHDLLERGNIEDYGYYEDGIFVRIPYEYIKQIEYMEEEFNGNEYCIEEYYYILEDYLEEHQDEMSDFEKEAFEIAIKNGLETYYAISAVYNEIPLMY